MLHSTADASSAPLFAEVEFPPLISSEPDPAWNLGIYAQYIVLRYFRELLIQRDVVWANNEIEGVHRIRVAARRCRTALQTVGALWDDEEVLHFQKYLARFADVFGTARDLDVMLIYLRKQVAQTHAEREAAYRWLLNRNTEKRDAEQPKLETALRKLESDGFVQSLVDYFSRQPVDLWAIEVCDG